MWKKVLKSLARIAWTAVSISAVTALIWLYAEGENIRRYDTSMDINLVSPSGRDLVIDPAHRSFQVAFTCSADQLAQFRQLLQNPLTLEVNEDIHSTNQILVMRDRLAADPRISQLGVNIVDVQPATLPLHVESMTTMTLPIRVIPPAKSIAENMTIDPVTDPAQATIHLPASVARKALDDTAFEVALNPSKLANLTPNVVNRLSIPLSLPAIFKPSREAYASAITIEPATVNVSVTVRTLTAQTTLPAIPIKLVISPSDLRNYELPVLADDHVRNLTFLGPRDVIKDIQDGKIWMYAELRLTAEDLETASRNPEGGSAFPVVNTPSGVTVTNLTTAIRYKVARRQQQ